jgi:hypothetical protein
MKAKIIFIDFDKEWHSEKYNKTYYQFSVTYEVDGITKDGQYTSTQNPQTTFVAGNEYDVTEEQKEYQGEIYHKIKPVRDTNLGGSNYGRKLKQEQSKYSGFSSAYIKDMLVSETLKPEMNDDDIRQNDAIMLTLRKRSKEIFDHMVKLDKSIQS